MTYSQSCDLYTIRKSAKDGDLGVGGSLLSCLLGQYSRMDSSDCLAVVRLEDLDLLSPPPPLTRPLNLQGGNDFASLFFRSPQTKGAKTCLFPFCSAWFFVFIFFFCFVGKYSLFSVYVLLILGNYFFNT